MRFDSIRIGRRSLQQMFKKIYSKINSNYAALCTQEGTPTSKFIEVRVVIRYRHVRSDFLNDTATLAYPFGALHARQISAGDYGTKSGISLAGSGKGGGGSRRRGGWNNLKRRTIVRKFTASDAPYLGRRTCISARRSDKDDPPPTKRKQSAQKIMCASVKASCPRPQTLPSGPQ